MKVLFLDVDGVLNSHKTGGLYALKKKCLRLLQDIVESTDCKIVLSSTWRKDDYAMKRLRRVLSYRGIKIFSTTPDLSGNIGNIRGNEIAQWLDENKDLGITHYAILDDDGDMQDSQLRNFFQTDGMYGLTETIAYRVKRKFEWVPDNKGITI